MIVLEVGKFRSHSKALKQVTEERPTLGLSPVSEGSREWAKISVKRWTHLYAEKTVLSKPSGSLMKGVAIQGTSALSCHHSDTRIAEG